MYLRRRQLTHRSSYASDQLQIFYGRSTVLEVPNSLKNISKLDNGDAQPPATSTHSGRQLPCLPSTSGMSVSHLHRQPTPFSFGGSGVAQYSSSSRCSFSST